MGDVSVSFVGTVARLPELRRVADGIPVCNFRVASTPRRLDRAKGEWVDGETLFFGVSCWRRLAEHVRESLSVGDTVLVRGRLTKRVYQTRDGEERESLDVEATEVAVDLARGVARQERARRESAGQPGEDLAGQPVDEQEPEPPVSDEAVPVGSGAGAEDAA